MVMLILISQQPLAVLVVLPTLLQMLILQVLVLVMLQLLVLEQHQSQLPKQLMPIIIQPLQQLL